MISSSSEYDLYCVNYKHPLHFMTFTAENPWLNELSEGNPYVYKIMINTETAKAKGVRDGDVESQKRQGILNH